MSGTRRRRYSLWERAAGPVRMLLTCFLRESTDDVHDRTEILALAAIGFVLAVIVAAYMIISRKKGWM